MEVINFEFHAYTHRQGNFQTISDGSVTQDKCDPLPGQPDYWINDSLHIIPNDNYQIAPNFYYGG